MVETYLLGFITGLLTGSLLTGYLMYKQVRKYKHIISSKNKQLAGLRPKPRKRGVFHL